MATIPIKANKLPKELQARFRAIPKTVLRGLNIGAMRGKAILQHRTPVSTGRLKAAWRVRKGTRWANQYGSGNTNPEIQNSAPHAGIIEEGARPHPVSLEGIQSLTRWARRTPHLFSMSSLFWR